MPTAFKRYAVDGDGDGRRDVVDDPADLIASTANNLKKDGWQTGQTWGFEVVVPAGFLHRLSSLVDCDQILVMEKGRVADLAPHTVLLERCAIYRHLWVQQDRHLVG